MKCKEYYACMLIWSYHPMLSTNVSSPLSSPGCNSSSLLLNLCLCSVIGQVEVPKIKEL